MLNSNQYWIKTGYINDDMIVSHDGQFNAPYSEFKQCFPNPYDGVYIASNGAKYGYIIDMADCSEVIKIVHFE